jgi:hypothetical protein
MPSSIKKAPCCFAGRYANLNRSFAAIASICIDDFDGDEQYGGECLP